MRGFKTGAVSRRQSRGVLLLAILAVLGAESACGAESTIELGGAHAWNSVAHWENVRTEPGWNGGSDIVLREHLPPVFPSTDLLLQTEGRLVDAAGNYSIVTGHDALTEFHARTGRRSLHFTGANELVIRPNCSNAMLGSNQQVRSFTIEAWVYPMSTGDNARIFRWTGTRFNTDGVPQRQEFAFSIQNRRLVWTLANMFLPPDGSPNTIELTARTILVPEQWRHHQLSFDGTTGKITYRVDGVPEAIAYANDAGRETGRSWYIHTGSECEDGLFLGSGFIGLVDDVRITRNAVEEPSLLPYDGRPGVVMTDLIDLGSDGASIESIDVRAVVPGNTAVDLFYRIGRRRSAWDAEEAIAAAWRRVPDNFEQTERETGRFAQIKAYLYPDAGRNESPRIQNIEIGVSHEPPPIPPQVIRAEEIPGGVRVSWSPVRSDAVAGYRVYLGEERGRYVGTRSVVSPIDVGLATEIEFTALEPGRPYVFAVESYDLHGQFSVLSPETEARAGRMDQ